jgi:hypothetical protein
MRKLRIVGAAFCAAFALLLQLSPAQAQASRTWVSGVGDDANPCSRTAPCKTFAGAISKTAEFGEISVLDPGGFGALTITKSISIVSDGSEGSIFASSVNGIIIAAGADDVVNLHGLFIEGFANGLNGIRFLSGARLHVSNCLIRGFRGGTGRALDVQPAARARIFVSNCTLADNTEGVYLNPTGNQSATVILDDVRVEGNTAAGVTADGDNAVVRLNESTVANNATGLNPLNGAIIHSYGNNVVHGNTVNGDPTATIPLE